MSTTAPDPDLTPAMRDALATIASGDQVDGRSWRAVSALHRRGLVTFVSGLAHVTDLGRAIASNLSVVTALTAGTRYVCTTTAKLRGERVYRTTTFTASRDMEPEPMVRGSENTPDQDRVFYVREGSSAPMLVVTGTIRPAGRVRVS